MYSIVTRKAAHETCVLIFKGTHENLDCLNGTEYRNVAEMSNLDHARFKAQKIAEGLGKETELGEGFRIMDRQDVMEEGAVSGYYAGDYEPIMDMDDFMISMEAEVRGLMATYDDLEDACTSIAEDTGCRPTRRQLADWIDAQAKAAGIDVIPEGFKTC